MVKDNTYVSIQAFMVNDLRLKGNELIIYAVIFGYTQDGNHWYYGTRGHLSGWCGATKGTVSNCLKSLQEKGYIRRREVERNGYTEVQYQAISTPYQNLTGGDTKNCDTPLSKNSSNNNIGDKDNSDNKKERKTYDGIIRQYFHEPELIEAVTEFVKMRKLIKAPMTDRALTRLLNKLCCMAHDTETRIAILDASIMNSWKDIYPLGNAKPSKQKGEVNDDADLEEYLRRLDL